MVKKSVSIQYLIDRIEKSKDEEELTKNILAFLNSSFKLEAMNYCYENHNEIYKKLEKCSCCGDYHIVEEHRKDINNKKICKKCLLENYGLCSICGRYHKKINLSLQIFETTRGDKKTIVCESCKVNFNRCRVCGKLIQEGETCSRCKGMYEGIEKFRIKSYDYVPKKTKFFKMDNEEEINYIGLELEVDGAGESNKNAFIVEKNTNKMIYVVHDGSLNDGFEMVTNPMSKNFLFNFLDYCNESIFKFLTKKGYKSDETGTCGLHIHIDKDIMNTKQFEKCYKLMYSDQEFMDKISRRRGNIDRWSSIKAPVENRNKVCTINIEDCYEGDCSCCGYWEDSTIYKYCLSNKYVALNNKHKNTYEFRLFKGSLNVNTIKACVEFTEFIVELAKDTSVKTNDFKFVNYMDRMKPNLYNYVIERLGLEMETKTNYDYTKENIKDLCFEDVEEVKKEILTIKRSKIDNHKFNLFNSHIELNIIEDAIETKKRNRIYYEKDNLI